MKYADRTTLSFPCTPQAFRIWYDATRGENGISDFQLAAGFVEELGRFDAVTSANIRPSVPAPAVIGAFRVRPTDSANKAWWNLRFRGAKRYRLALARASTGAAKKPSRWYPEVVAAWLVHEGILPEEAVRRAFERAFPDHDLLGF